MAPHAALEEIGTPFELILVDTKAGAHKRPDYLKLNPNGRVPTLVHDDLAIYESAAIAMHLADWSLASRLAPQIGAPARALYYQWMVYLTNTVQEAYMHYFHPENFCSHPAAHDDIKRVAECRLQSMFVILDTALAKGPYLLGPQFCAADLFLMMLVRWSRNMTNPAANFANIKRCFDLVRARPAVERMYQAQGLS